ncbi:MAG: LysR family transcriptional regulator [Notoacmeibacter sp.]|nr:LysR family transcriptional regulator [Notoacmeibacter sp.]
MNLLAFDLNLLRVLDALLQEQSTVKAGERVGLSQPAVSAALARLRHALGDPLFVRQGQRLVPTDYARELELPLRRIFDDLVSLLSGPHRFDPAASTQHFKISGSDFYSELLMPQLAETLSRLAPGMQVQQVDLVPDNYVNTLEDREIDLAIIPKTEYPPWVESTPVHRSNFVMIARNGHQRLQRAGIEPGTVVPIDLFCDLGHVVFSPEGNLRAMGDAALARLGRERRVVMTMPVMGGVATAIAASDLVAIMPEQLARKLAPRLGLSIYVPPMPVGPVQICMLWHKRSTSNPAHRWLRGIVSGILSRLDDPGTWAQAAP